MAASALRTTAGGAVRLRAQFGALADGGRRCSSISSAATYVGSAGVRKGELDPFAVAAMDEIGIDIAKHQPMTFEELEDWEGLNFDLIVTLVARGAPQGAGADPHDGGRGRILADARSDRDRRHAASSASMPTARCATS